MQDIYFNAYKLLNSKWLCPVDWIIIECEVCLLKYLKYVSKNFKVFKAHMLRDKMKKWKNIISWVLFVCSGVIVRDKNTLMYNYSRDNLIRSLPRTSQKFYKSIMSYFILLSWKKNYSLFHIFQLNWVIREQICKFAMDYWLQNESLLFEMRKKCMSVVFQEKIHKMWRTCNVRIFLF